MLKPVCIKSGVSRKLVMYCSNEPYRSLHVQFDIVAPETKMSSRVTALVMIEDMNDHSPVFQNRPGVTVMEDEPVGYPIIHVIATDDDSHDAGRVTYSIVQGNEKGHFVIDSTSGN